MCLKAHSSESLWWWLIEPTETVSSAADPWSSGYSRSFGQGNLGNVAHLACCFSGALTVDDLQTCQYNLTATGPNKSHRTKQFHIAPHDLFFIEQVTWLTVTLLFGEWLPLEYTFSQLTLVLTQVKHGQIPEARTSVSVYVCADRWSIP